MPRIRTHMLMKPHMQAEKDRDPDSDYKIPHNFNIKMADVLHNSDCKIFDVKILTLTNSLRSSTRRTTSRNRRSPRTRS